MSESKTSVRRLEAAKRQTQALELRMAGYSYPKIAEALGYASMSGALKAVDSALIRTQQEPADKVRKLEVSRLDKIIAAHWQNAMGGDAKAAELVLKVMVRRAALLGLDAPKKLEMSAGIEVKSYMNVDPARMLTLQAPMLDKESTGKLTG